MRTPDELDQLLDAVLAPDHPDESLAPMLSAVRSRNRRRKLTRSVALLVLPIVLAGGLWLQQASSRQDLHQTDATPEAIASTTPQTVPGTDIRLISDEELFALFPDRPLALIGPKGAQQLVFLDEL